MRRLIYRFAEFNTRIYEEGDEVYAEVEIEEEVTRYDVTIDTSLEGDSKQAVIHALYTSGKLDFDFTEKGILLQEKRVTPVQSAVVAHTPTIYEQMRGTNFEISLSGGQVTEFKALPTEQALAHLDRETQEQVTIINERRQMETAIIQQRVKEGLAEIETQGRRAREKNRFANEKALVLVKTAIQTQENEERKEHAKLLANLQAKSSAEEKETKKLDAKLKEERELKAEKLDHQQASLVEANRTKEKLAKKQREEEKHLEDLQLSQELEEINRRRQRETAIAQADAKTEEQAAATAADESLSHMKQEHGIKVTRVQTRQQAVASQKESEDRELEAQLELLDQISESKRQVAEAQSQSKVHKLKRDNEVAEASSAQQHQTSLSKEKLQYQMARNASARAHQKAMDKGCGVF